jgi:hypothetical protein
MKHLQITKLVGNMKILAKLLIFIIKLPFALIFAIGADAEPSHDISSDEYNYYFGDHD